MTSEREEVTGAASDCIIVKPIIAAMEHKETGRIVEVPAVHFSFRSIHDPDQAVAEVGFVGGPKELRKAGTIIRDACYRAAKLAEGRA